MEIRLFKYSFVEFFKARLNTKTGISWASGTVNMGPFSSSTRQCT